jgi:predicted unusual protein kinase regulating ubiquinone biosynthesis (AarF/ABC1/UbiB family)
MEDLFLEFDSVPVGAASVAQAHRAVLADGRMVIVKVSEEGASLVHLIFII